VTLPPLLAVGTFFGTAGGAGTARKYGAILTDSIKRAGHGSDRSPWISTLGNMQR
jgi:hypothetical protein